MDWTKYRHRVREQFHRLLAKAEANNKLYYLLNLFGTGSIRWSKEFISQVNLVTSTLVLNRARENRSEIVPPHEAIFVLQLNLEAKAFYAALRNFVHVAAGDRFAPEPWRMRNEARTSKAGISLSTGTIIRNLTEELRVAGFRYLGNEFERTHAKETAQIRNSVAHATFLFPSTATRQRWVFANYVPSGPAHVAISPQYMSHRRFQEIYRRFLAFRLAFLACYDAHRLRYSSQKFHFRAPNQTKPTELLECDFDSGSLKIMYQGTPLW